MPLKSFFMKVTHATKIADLLKAAKAQNQRITATKTTNGTKTPNHQLPTTSTVPTNVEAHISIYTAEAYVSKHLVADPRSSPDNHANIIGMFTYGSEYQHTSWTFTANGTLLSTAEQASNSFREQHNLPINTSFELVLQAVVPVKQFLSRLISLQSLSIK